MQYNSVSSLTTPNVLPISQPGFIANTRNLPRDTSMSISTPALERVEKSYDQSRLHSLHSKTTTQEDSEYESDTDSDSDDDSPSTPIRSPPTRASHVTASASDELSSAIKPRKNLNPDPTASTENIVSKEPHIKDDTSTNDRQLSVVDVASKARTPMTTSTPSVHDNKYFKIA